MILTTTDFAFVSTPEDSHYLIFSVTGDIQVDPSDFALERAGAVTTPPEAAREASRVHDACPQQCIGLPVRFRSAPDAALVFTNSAGTATWTLPEPLGRSLGLRSDLILQAVSVIERRGELGLRFTVENRGERDGVFVALVAPASLADVSDPVGFPVPTGEIVSHAVVPPALGTYDPARARVSTEITAKTRYIEVEAG